MLKNFLNKNVKGYALIFALVFITLISLLLFFIIEARKLESMSLNRNIDKQLALLNLKQVLQNQIVEYGGFADKGIINFRAENFEFRINNDYWGLFPLIIANAYSNLDTFKLVSLYGYKADSTALSILFERQD